MRSGRTFHAWPRRRFPHQHAVKLKGKRRRTEGPRLAPPTEKHANIDPDSAQKASVSSCPAQRGDEFSAADVTRVTGACSSWGKQRIVLAFWEIALPAYLPRTFIGHQSMGNEAPVLATGPGLGVFRGEEGARAGGWLLLRRATKWTEPTGTHPAAHEHILIFLHHHRAEVGQNH